MIEFLAYPPFFRLFDHAALVADGASRQKYQRDNYRQPSYN